MDHNYSRMSSSCQEKTMPIACVMPIKPLTVTSSISKLVEGNDTRRLFICCSLIPIPFIFVFQIFLSTSRQGAFQDIQIVCLYMFQIYDFELQLVLSHVRYPSSNQDS